MIKRLQITSLRNLSQVKLDSSRCNIIVGNNGSGKTSLLESIYLLSRGKSFRTHQPSRYIQHRQDATTVFALFTDTTQLAIQKHTDATTLLRFNGNSVKTQSSLTHYMPTLLIDPSSMDILEQGSASRRQLLDWLAFHVKPKFYSEWLAYQRLLKQRNSLLKQTSFINDLQKQQIKAWDIGLATHAKAIHAYRQQVFNEWQPHFLASIKQLLPKYAEQINVSYHPGFDTDKSLDIILEQRLVQDLQQGYTRVGSHRADIHVHWQSVTEDNKKVKDQAANVLSRGEKKLLITALRLSQLPLLQNELKDNDCINNDVSYETYNKTVSVPIVLLDDITAELDDKAVKVLLNTLSNLECQVFVTCLTEEVLPLIKQYWQDFRLFHMKQGNIFIE